MQYVYLMWDIRYYSSYISPEIRNDSGYDFFLRHSKTNIFSQRYGTNKTNVLEDTKFMYIISEKYKIFPIHFQCTRAFRHNYVQPEKDGCYDTMFSHCTRPISFTSLNIRATRFNQYL